MINRISGLLEGAEVCVRVCNTSVRHRRVCVCLCVCAFVAAVCLFFFLFPGHTHTQLLSVSVRLTILKIAVQSMLDLLPHQSHTSGRASFSPRVSHYSVFVALGEESRRRHTESAMKEKMKSLSQTSPPRSPLLLYLTKSPWMRRRRRRDRS